jgi:hypothetical protein
VADCVPVPLRGSDLKAHLSVNPSSVCPSRVSQLCSPSLTWHIRSSLLSLPEVANIYLRGSWEEEGHPFYFFKYNIPFWGSPGLYLPSKKKTCYQPSPLMYRAFMVVISPFIHGVLFELACFFCWKCLKCLGYRARRQGTSSVSGFGRVT